MCKETGFHMCDTIRVSIIIVHFSSFAKKNGSEKSAIFQTVWAVAQGMRIWHRKRKQNVFFSAYIPIPMFFFYAYSAILLTAT